MTEPSQSEEVERPQPFSTARQPSSGPISQTGIDPAYSQRALQRACQDEYGRGIWLDATPHPRHIVRRHIAPHACSAPANAPLLPCRWPSACGSVTNGVPGVSGLCLSTKEPFPACVRRRNHASHWRCGSLALRPYRATHRPNRMDRARRGVGLLLVQHHTHHPGIK